MSSPDINSSTYTFSPDIEHNTIRYGLSGITRISTELIKTIMENRPYEGLDDFLTKVKVNKIQMVNLIKSGAFDIFGDRIDIMKSYVDKISDKKKKLTLQNMKMLCDFDLLPSNLDFEKKVFHFNRYLKKMKIGTEAYEMDNIAYNFYEQNFDLDLLKSGATESGFIIGQKTWDTIYKKQMDKVREYIKANQEELLNKLNSILFEEVWNKYCLGSLSKWEMDSISCYLHEHELKGIRNGLYGLSNYNELSDEPDIEYTFHTKDGKEVPIFRIERIAGTVLDRDKNKKTVTLLTSSNVVVVKIYGEVFSNYDKRISEVGADGKKHVIEESFFKRGNKIMVCGLRREDGFQAKKYSKTPYHLVELIEQVNEDGTLVSRGERAKVDVA